MIEVGEYIRTDKDPEVLKIIEVRKENKCITDKYPNLILQLNRDFTKHSKNIIDVLEIGDYVNGFRIDEIHDFPNGTSRVICNKYIGKCESIPDAGVISVVTKEQFLSIAYIR